MGKDKKNPVTIDGKEYQLEDFTVEEQAMLDHIADLDRKLASARFNLDQLDVGRAAFFNMLKASLETKEVASG